MSGTGSAGAVVLVCALLAGCGEAAVSTPRSSTEAELRDVWEQERPADHRYVLDSSCGERSGVGRYAVEVRGSELFAVTGLDESARTSLAGGEDPPLTLDELLTEADAARERGADVVDLVLDPGDGHLVSLRLDADLGAIDDEACYEVTDFQVGG